ncbi:hypothetical protein LTS15_007131 [Exophiala xenobiotica]|nr:hypothetical protein LTS15_007131 [Exophiala xenobiotica]
MDEFDDKYYALTRVNCIDECMPNSEDDVFMQLYELYNQWIALEATYTTATKKQKKIDERWDAFVNSAQDGSKNGHEAVSDATRQRHVARDDKGVVHHLHALL